MYVHEIALQPTGRMQTHIHIHTHLQHVQTDNLYAYWPVGHGKMLHNSSSKQPVEPSQVTYRQSNQGKGKQIGLPCPSKYLSIKTLFAFAAPSHALLALRLILFLVAFAVVTLQLERFLARTLPSPQLATLLHFLPDLPADLVQPLLRVQRGEGTDGEPC